VSALDDLRIIVDLQASQSAAHAERGIARYSLELTRALLRRGAPIHALAVNPNLPPPRGLPPDLAASPLLTDRSARTFAAAAELGRVAYHVMSPIELELPAPLVLSRSGLVRSDALVVVLYDLIPLIFADRYLTDDRVRLPYLARLQLVRDADLVLAISEHTRRDGIEHLGLDPARVVTIGGGASEAFRPAAPGADPAAEVRRARATVTKPFVLTVAGYEWRKNTEALIEAFARLPEHVRTAHQLVVACSVPAEGERTWREHARACGLGDADLVVTGYVDDALLRSLYQAAALFVFPSRYEGYGLPALEAASCGTPVLTSDSSSLPEILDLPASTFPPHDIAAMCERIEAALTDDALRSALLAAGARAAAAHTWDAVADRTLAAYDRLAERTGDTNDPGSNAGDVPGRARASRAARPRVAFVGPLPPVESGVALYNERVLGALPLEGIDLEIFHETPRGRAAPRSPVDAPCYPLDALGSRLDPHDYDSIVYTIGDSGYHVRTFDLARRVPGVLWLHDACLVGLHLEWAQWLLRTQRRTGDVLSVYRDEITAMYDGRVRPDAVLTEPLSHRSFVAQQVYLNARVVRASRRLVVNSELAHDMVRHDAGAGATVPPITVLRHAFPDRSVLPISPTRPRRSRPLVVALGIVHPIKRPEVLLQAIAALDLEVDLAFVGPCEEPLRRELLDVAHRLGIAARTTITGYVDVPEYARWISEADVAVQLREVSFGESSGAVHDAIAGGVPVVTSIASAADLPPEVVTMVAPQAPAGELTAAIRAVLVDPSERARRQEASRELAASWSFTRVAREILDVVRADAAAR
jgi:glycosyltransferase involved in cell wall biosynthesis